MTKVMLTCGDYQFFARLEEEKAPRTCAIFKKMLPIEDRLIHVRWSGEGMWIPMGDTRWEGLDFENHTSYPSKGELLIYPGGISEMEMILAYGGVSFASKVGQLAGNHVLTITEGLDQLYELGRKTLYEGAQNIRIELAED
ncbi:Protein of uncharacterised function (DUF3830) [uncultured Flavonifractor sp.]|jgi:hypothetical protein|uniref:DUF3830 family protein n=1 Tax=Flintibacter hominis TaxID=2763048 RepID=A0A8J6IXM6_9FIRM|nr:MULTISPECIES: DUF3830 family protein [Eubacteriales]MBS5590029.1 DUF3830 family protein [Clostridiales bacterium]SCH77620.1 Protein of uncharacterised function (DUF3830) [uncultured Clostridium sp.]SCI59158.1 Protein of uncharacterised function (DUF3830) [uncultured Flavonifractor sp.]MBC5722305.1 DUF3830 family protein [Flintibacter hominis]MCH1979848.1 DUF3830 family protein [Lawsonibacter sp. OA9]